MSVQAHGCRRTEACFTCCQLLKGDVLPAGTSCWYMTYQSTAGSAPMLFLVRALGTSWNRVVWRLALMSGFALGPRRSGLLSCCVCGQPVRSPLPLFAKTKSGIPQEGCCKLASCCTGQVHTLLLHMHLKRLGKVQSESPKLRCVSYATYCCFLLSHGKAASPVCPCCQHDQRWAWSQWDRGGSSWGSSSGRELSLVNHTPRTTPTLPALPVTDL